VGLSARRVILNYKEKFEDTKVVIRQHKSEKDQKIRVEDSANNLHNTTQKQNED
jgi:hypothetical protein